MCGFLLALIMGRAMHGLYLYFVNRRRGIVLFSFVLHPDSNCRYQIADDIILLSFTNGKISTLPYFLNPVIIILNSDYVIFIEFAERQFQNNAVRVWCCYSMFCSPGYCYVFTFSQMHFFVLNLYKCLTFDNSPQFISFGMILKT